MFSAANEYIDGELKRRVLDPFVESYDTETSETRSGLLGGEASLQNLVLKKRRWVFGQLVLSMDYGRMESLALNFPWLTSKTFSVCHFAAMAPCLLSCSVSPVSLALTNPFLLSFLFPDGHCKTTGLPRRHCVPRASSHGQR
jgi:hypothetical protein